MDPIETTETDIEPAWDSFGISRVDFRPQWDGDLVNLFSTVEPQVSEPATEQMMIECARALAGWVILHRDRFRSEDRFQIIVGWPGTVRENGRQAIKTGGTYEDLRKIAAGVQPVTMRLGWSLGVFAQTKEGYHDRQATASPPHAT